VERRSSKINRTDKIFKRQVLLLGAIAVSITIVDERFETQAPSSPCSVEFIITNLRFAN